MRPDSGIVKDATFINSNTAYRPPFQVSLSPTCHGLSAIASPIEPPINTPCLQDPLYVLSSFLHRIVLDHLIDVAKISAPPSRRRLRRCSLPTCFAAFKLGMTRA